MGSPSTFRSLGDYVDAVARAVDAAGAEHVGFGTDNSGFGATPAVWDDYRDFPVVVRLMRKRGFAPDEIRKIAGGNYLRVLTCRSGPARRLSRLSEAVMTLDVPSLRLDTPVWPTFSTSTTRAPPCRRVRSRRGDGPSGA